MQIDIPDPQALIALIEKAQRSEEFNDLDHRVADAWLAHLCAARRRYMQHVEFQAALQRKTAHYFAPLGERTTVCSCKEQCQGAPDCRRSTPKERRAAIDHERASAGFWEA